ncbi:MAG: hypothetical protein NTX70_06980 [Verrucomicrobia bacterium]|nr:hypothetical protein [Verrucomicrobiota bacterium]
MKRLSPQSSRRGVALVITLIMLSVVTITAVAFLTVARRERAAVAAAGEQADVRIAADAALNRARARILAQIASSGLRESPTLFVSTNFIAPFYIPGRTTAGQGLPLGGAQSNQWYSALANVSYLYQGRPFDLNNTAEILEYRRMLANLYYDPRVPVVARTGRLDTRVDSFEDRFYLDLNRNGRFETNGYIFQRNVGGVAIDTNRVWHVGDPEWIGVLADPDRPHSGNNRFLYRIAYLVVPADQTVDLNHAHNQARNPDATTSQFLRNQGVATWELNLAGLFRDLNTNLWQTYAYSTNAANTGLTFDHALNVWLNRRVATVAGRATAQDILTEDSRPQMGVAGDTAAASRVLPLNGVDDLSDGPLIQSLAQVRNPRLLNDGDNVTRRWSGGDVSNPYLTPFPLLSDPNLLPLGPNRVIWTNLDTRRTAFAGQLMSPVQASNSTYNAYTFYRLLGSVGTDSSDGRIEVGVDLANRYYRRSKLNLNYQVLDPEGAQSFSANVVATNGASGSAARATALVPWTARTWVQLAGDRLLRKEFSNGLPELANFNFYDPANPSSKLAVPQAKEAAAHGIAIAGSYWVTNAVGSGGRNQAVSLTNHTWSAKLHRLLQLAANIHEVRTNIVGGLNSEPFPPNVFRPTFYREDQDDPRNPGKKLSVVRLAGLEEVTNAVTQVLNTAWTNWMDFENPIDVANLSTDPSLPTRTNVFGIPYLVGTKQNQTGPNALGLPKFNEAFWQTRVRTGRRLLLERQPNGAVRPTNETTLSALGVVKYGQYTFQVINTAAAEGWNSYLQAFPANRSLRLIATNWTEVCLYDGSLTNAAQPLGQPLFIPQPLNPNLPLSGQNPMVYNRTNYALQVGNVVNIGSNKSKARWLSGEYIPALNTNTSFGLVYNPVLGRVFPITETNNLLAMFPMPGTRPDRLIPKLNIAVTNRLVFAIVDESFVTNRLLDFVNIKSGTVEKDILENLVHTAGGLLPEVRGDSGINLGFDNTGGNVGGSTASEWPNPMPRLWQTNFPAGGVIPAGFESQFTASLNPGLVRNLWVEPRIPGFVTTGVPQEDAALGLKAFLYGINSVPRSSQVVARRELDRLLASGGNPNGNRIQVGFNPVGEVHLTDRRMANDPMVHYTKEDLQPGGLVYTHPEGYWKFYSDVYFNPNSEAPFDRRPEDLQLDPGVSTNHVAAPFKTINAYAPWGGRANLGFGIGISPNALSVDMAYKDPLVTDSAAWSFPTPTNAFASIGQLGRIHRGTPWQTVYLKSSIANIVGNGEDHIADRYHWKWWSGSYGTHPTNDWALLDTFSTALTENAGRGQIGVNQTNLSAWSAILSGVPVLRRLNNDGNNLVATVLDPAGANGASSLQKIVGGYITNGLFRHGIASGFIHTNGWPGDPLVTVTGPDGKSLTIPKARRSLPRFQSVGEICSVETLSVGSPLLENVEYDESNPGRTFRPVSDEVVERIPQQILSLLKAEEPRYVIYAWAQTLKPAPGAVVTAPGPFFGLSTNYVVTGEFATKTVLRFEGALSTNAPVTQTLRSVVEDHRVLTTD